MTPEQEQLEADILAYVEGELPPDKAARLEVYLDNGDPKLAARVRGMMDDRQVLRSAPKLRAPGDLSERIMERIERTSLLGASIDHQLITENRQWWQSRMAIAAGLLLICGVFGYFVADSVWPRHEENWTPVAKGPEISPLPALRDAETFPSEALADAAPAMAAPDASKSLVSAATVPAAEAAISRETAALKPAAAAPVAPVAAPEQVVLANAAEAPTAQAAIDNLRQQQSPAENPLPLVVTLLAQNPADMERLKTTLTGFVMEGERAVDAKTAAPAPGAATQSAYKMDALPELNPSPERKKQMADAIAAGELGSRYRMRLRPQQLESLTHQFTVASISRGPQAFVIQNNDRLARGDVNSVPGFSKESTGSINGNDRAAANDVQDLATKNSAPQQVAQAKAEPSAVNSPASAPAGTAGEAGAAGGARFGRGGGGGGGGRSFGGARGGRGNAQATAAPETNNQAGAAANQDLAANNKLAENTKDQKAPAQMENNLQRQSAQRELDMAQPWIDCIITLMPGAAPDNAPQTKQPQ